MRRFASIGPFLMTATGAACFIAAETGETVVLCRAYAGDSRRNRVAMGPV